MDRLESGTSIIYCDDSRFPVVVNTWVGTATIENCERFVAWYAERLERARVEGLRMVSIADATEAERPPPQVRRFFADWLRGLQEDNKTVESDSVVVINNALVRGAMTAIGWLVPSVRDLIIVSTMPEALSKARDLLTEHGLPIPADFDLSYTKSGRRTTG